MTNLRCSQCSEMEIWEEDIDLEERLCLLTCYVNQGTRNIHAAVCFSNTKCCIALQSTLQAGPGLLHSQSKPGPTQAVSEPEDMQLGWNGAQSEAIHPVPSLKTRLVNLDPEPHTVVVQIELVPNECTSGSPQSSEAIPYPLPATLLALCSTWTALSWKHRVQLIANRTQLQMPRGNKWTTFSVVCDRSSGTLS